jgi:serine/threonine-protein kinase
LKRIGDIQLFAEIKRGEHGSTYRGFDTAKQEFVLVKTIRAGSGATSSNGAQSRFEQEAAIYASIHHPNVVRLLHYGTVDAQRYIALEFVEGLTLRALLDRSAASGGLPWEIALAIFCEVLEGVQEIHRHGIVHRDLKPENILISNHGEVKICDFDLALSEQAGRSNSSTRLAEAGLSGSPGYMAPESVLGEKTTPASDVFSLGIVLYETLTGARPFHAPSATGEMNAIVKLAHVSLLALNPALPAGFDELIDRLLAKKPHERLASIDEAMKRLQDYFITATPGARREMLQCFLADFQTILQGVAIRQKAGDAGAVAKPKAWPRARRLAAGLLSAGLAVAGFWAWNNRTREPESSQPITMTPASAVQARLSDVDESALVDGAPKILKETAPATKKPASNVEIKRDESADSSAIVEPRFYEVSINSNPWAFVFIDGDSIGQTPLRSPVILREGSHEIHFKNPKFPLIRTAAEIGENASPALSFSLWEHVAQLEIHVTPWADVFIDGQRRELPPGEEALILLPGKHSLRFVHPQLGEKNETVFLLAGETRKLTMIMF